MATSTAKILAIIAATLCTSVALAAQRTFDKQLSAPPGGRLTFDADVGSVTIVGRDAPEVVVHAKLEGSESLLDRLHIRAEQTASGVTVAARAAHNGWLDWFSWGSTRVDFTIEVPRNYPVDLRTSGGGIDVRGLNATVLGKTSGGGIRLQNINGGINMHTSGGSIDGDHLNGPAELSSSGGPIDVTDSTGNLDLDTSGGGIHVQNDDGTVQAHTSGGSIRAELRSNHGISLSTSGGSITLLLPQNTPGSLDAETSGGSVTSDFPLTTTHFSSGSHLQGTIGGGGAPISLHTSGGSIRLGPES
ncbi:MAG TPA: DUF4097 family beta strand repeat-containing protein [Steroidobacteraceae bacterium]|jgi:DUF4097 and DUF4098 domain-containing protein YvlB